MPLAPQVDGDITVQRSALQDSQESRAQLEAIIRSAMDAIITVDEHQRITVFNHAAQMMFGCSADEALGQHLERFIPERFRRDHREHVCRFSKTKTTNRAMGRCRSRSISCAGVPSRTCADCGLPARIPQCLRPHSGPRWTAQTPSCSARPTRS